MIKTEHINNGLFSHYDKVVCWLLFVSLKSMNSGNKTDCLKRNLTSHLLECVEVVLHAVWSWRPTQGEMEWLNQLAPCAAAGGTCWSQGPGLGGSAERLEVVPVEVR